MTRLMLNILPPAVSERNVANTSNRCTPCAVAEKHPVWQLIGASLLFRYCLFRATLRSLAGAFRRGKLMRMKLLMTVQFVK